MQRRDFAAAFTALTAAISAHAQAVSGVAAPFTPAPPTPVSPNGKPRPKNGECPHCATLNAPIGKVVTGCKKWVSQNGTVACPPDQIKTGKAIVPDNAVELPNGTFAIRCLHCSGVFIQDPE